MDQHEQSTRMRWRSKNSCYPLMHPNYTGNNVHFLTQVPCFSFFLLISAIDSNTEEIKSGNGITNKRSFTIYYILPYCARSTSHIVACVLCPVLREIGATTSQRTTITRVTQFLPFKSTTNQITTLILSFAARRRRYPARG